MNKLFVLYSCVYSKVSLKDCSFIAFSLSYAFLALCDVRGGPVVKIWSITGPHKE